MEHPLYHGLKQKLIAITLAVSLTPLIVLGFTLYVQFERMYRKITSKSGSQPDES